MLAPSMRHQHRQLRFGDVLLLALQNAIMLVVAAQMAPHGSPKIAGAFTRCIFASNSAVHAAMFRTLT